jgi:predicted ATP-grasp superfamily ATP-dependent carboligase
MAHMKVFVFDPVAAGGSPTRPLPRSLRRQGEMVLQALLADLGALSGIEVVTPAGLAPGTVRDGGVDIGIAALDTGGAADWPHRFGTRFASGMDAADAVWPLASESEGALEHLSRAILRGKRLLLGSAPGAVEVAASKLKLARVLAEGGIAVVATYSPHAALPQDGGPWVVKPDDGAGCLDTRLFRDRTEALAWIRASAADHYVLQPFVAGKLGSLSLICCDGRARVLACNLERMAMRDNRFHFLGSVVNGLADDDGALARLAQQVAAAIPSLWGYVGVDFVLTANGAMVLDVNPRLTAAYAGLHASIGCNPAALVLDLLNNPAANPAAMAAPAGMRRAVSVDVATP